jgi:hypothetical protein
MCCISILYIINTIILEIMNYKVNYHQIANNYGYSLIKIPQEVLDELKILVDKQLITNFRSEIPYNDKLAGEIKHEYKIEPGPKLLSLIKACNNDFESHFNYYQKYFDYYHLDFNPLETGIPLNAKDHVWVNFQKKHEYNPTHRHNGVLSWVIWYQVPYTFENERNHSSKTNPNNINHGDFHFVYNHPFLNLTTVKLEVDKSAEGYMAMFPSSLNHEVYPFYTSDDFRITIAGNIMLEIDKLN